MAPRKPARWRCSTRSRRSGWTSSRRVATARPLSPKPSTRAGTSSRDAARRHAPRGRAGCRQACGRVGAQRAALADRGSDPHRSRRVPVPQLVAFDRHHGSRAADLRARGVRGRVGVRVHAQHDDAARPLARDRHSDRRRDRGAREHRQAHRDGEGSRDGGAHRHVRDRARRRGDDVLDRRGVRSDRVHGRHRRPVVQAVRADDGVVGAGLAVHLVLARPDAVGALARSAQAGASQGVDHASARRFNRWFDRLGERYHDVLAWALDHRMAMAGDRGWLVRRSRSGCRSRSAARTSCRPPIAARSRSTSMRRRARTSSTRRSVPSMRCASHERTPK